MATPVIAIPAVIAITIAMTAFRQSHLTGSCVCYTTITDCEKLKIMNSDYLQWHIVYIKTRQNLPNGS
jgi:FlaG/FlaF family flagellin (archaellin)